MMISIPIRRALLSWAALAAVAASCVASPELDLKRVVPVAADQPIPIQDFFRPPSWLEPKLNPAGTHVAALAHTEKDTYRLLVHNLGTQNTQTIGGAGDKDVDQFNWIDDGRLVFFLSRDKLYALGMFAFDVDKAGAPYPLLQYCGPRLVSIPPADRRYPLVWMRREVLENDRDGGVAVVTTGISTGRFVDFMDATLPPNALLDAQENNHKHVVKVYPAPKEGMVYHYMADRFGKLAFAFTSEKGVLALHRLESEREWKKSPIDLESTDVVTAGEEPGDVLANVFGEPNTPSVLRLVNTVTGAPGKVMIADNGYDFDGWVYREPASRLIVGATYDRDGPRTVWLDEGFRRVQQAVDALFPGQVAQIIGNSEKGSRFLVRTFSDRNPMSYHWVDLEKRSAGLLQNTAPWIDPARMRPMRIMKFKTRDGHELDAYVTLPKGTSKKTPVPLVVLPHGGPWVRDTWGYDGEVQFLASRGYAVLQPNYRGSTGYDWMFPGEDQWAFLKMHDDVTDATHALLATGVIDPGRVAIMGGSFGAYLALSGVVHEPKLYRCAVTISGVYDWATLLQSRKYDQYTNPSYARMLRKLGDPKVQKEKFAEISPLRHVDQVHVPVFVAHGKEDVVAEVSEGRRLVSELEKYKVHYEKLFISGEGHGMGHLTNEVELYSHIETFLAKNLAPLAEPAAAGSR